MATRGDRCASRYGRRSILGPLFGLALTPLLVGAVRAEDEVETTDAVTMPPQPGDHFVFLSGPNQAFPASPDGTIRNGTPLNLVILARFDPADLSEETRARAAEGVVAYSAVCTHQACPVNMWSKARDGLVCSCHGSVYDPKNGAAVVDVPAPRPLPSLAVKIADGAVAVASGFSSRVGGTQK
jgi:rieske iron-sulfur protein